MSRKKKNEPVVYLPLDAFCPAEDKLLVADTAGTEHEVAGNPEIVSDSTFGSAICFDGVGDSITIPDAPHLQLNAYTVALWVKPEGNRQRWTGIIGKPGRNNQIWIHGSGFIHHRFHIKGKTNAGAPDTAPGIVRENTWCHIAITNDGTTAKTYHNGAEVASGDVGELIVDKTPLIIGRHLDDKQANFFKGRMAHVRIYDRAMAPEEIEADMAADLGWGSRMSLSARVTENFDRATTSLDISAWERARLLHAQRRLEFDCLLTRDDGSLEVLEAFRVHHDSHRGPMQGNLRMSAGINEDEVTALAAMQTWRAALMGVPHGGSAGGIRCNPSDYSEAERNRIIEAYVAGLADILDPRHDILGLDAGSSPEDMNCAVQSLVGRAEAKFAAATGKTVDYGGCNMSRSPIAMGIYYAMENAFNQVNKRVGGMSYAIQGFGHVGSWIARLITDSGGKIVAVADAGGAVRDKGGLDCQRLCEAVAASGSVAGYQGGEQIDPDTILIQEVDVIIPAAISSVLTKENADEVKASFVVEAAEAATTPEADAILAARGITVLPELYVNGGAVIAAHIEWLQNNQETQWQEDQIEEEMGRLMHKAYTTMVDCAERHKLSLRAAAYRTGITRTLHALRGSCLAH